MKLLLIIKVLALSIVLTGCAMGPDYQRPEVTAPLQFKENRGWIQTAATVIPTHEKWWMVFGDATLNTLEERVAEHNLSLRASFFTYQQAIALTDVARAAEYQTVAATVASSKTSTGGISTTTGAVTTTSVSGDRKSVV